MALTENRSLEIATTAAIEAGELLKAQFVQHQVVVRGEGRDIKLQADVLAEQTILQILRRESEYPILSEERGADENLDSTGCYWIVDPLDGTFNFSRQLPFCAISIGLWKANEPVVGVVYDFTSDRVFAGVVSEGAWLNASRVSVSSVDRIDSAALLTGFPSGRNFSDDALSTFVRKVQRHKKVRLLGSAALSLAYVASGAADIYHEEDIYFWDVAAGLALVKAAGGRYSIKPGRSQWQFDVIASNKNLSEVAVLA